MPSKQILIRPIFGVHFTLRPIFRAALRAMLSGRVPAPDRSA